MLKELEKYRRLIGKLLYLNISKHDISYSVQQLSQFVNSPCQAHYKVVIYLLRYLKGCPSKGLPYLSENNRQLQAFSDADWASYIETWRSLTRFCIYLGLALILWKMKKQNTISRSSTEIEYKSLAATIYKLQWIFLCLKTIPDWVTTSNSIVVWQ